MSAKKGSCTTCPSRAICSSLCPEAEAYANQDEVYQREVTVGIRLPYPRPMPDPPLKLTETEKQIVSLLNKKHSRAGICELLGIKRNALEKHISRMKNKL